MSENSGEEAMKGKENGNNIKCMKSKLKKILSVLSRVVVGFLLVIGLFMWSDSRTVFDNILEMITYYSIIVFLIVIPLLILSNFKGIRDKLPLYKRRKFGSTFLALILTFYLSSTVSGLVVFAVDSLHTPQYKAEQERQRIEEEKIAAAEKKAAEEKAAEEKVAAEKKAAEKKAAEKEAAEKKAAEKKAAEKKAAEKKAAEKKAAEKKAAEEKAAAEKKAAEEKAAAEKKAAEEKAAAEKKAAEEKAAAEQQNHISTQWEQIQSSIAAAKKVEPKELMRSPSSYEYKNICITNYAIIEVDGTPFFSILGEIVYIHPRIIVDEEGNSVENLLTYDKIMVVGDFHFHNNTDEFGFTTSSINNAIIILME